MYSGDMAKLLEDVKALNPSVFISVPRLFNRINDKVSHLWMTLNSSVCVRRNVSNC